MTDHPSQSLTPAETGPPLRHRSTRSWLLFMLMAFAWLAADQWTKSWALEHLRADYGGSWSLWVNGKLQLAFTLVRNPGAAWGFFAETAESFRGPFFVVVSLGAMAFILYLFWKRRPEQRLLSAALPLLLGGAAGNFVDRIRWGSVVDFVDVRYGSYRWPTFNIADVAISLGVGLLFIDMVVGQVTDWRRYREHKRRSSPANAPAEDSSSDG